MNWIKVAAVYSFLFSSRLFFLFNTMLIVTACTDNIHLNIDDIRAMNRIYEVNTWLFQQSRVDLQAHVEGAIELKIQGEVTWKEAKPEGPLWLPVAFVRELPSYLKGNDESNQWAVELQAYKVKGGLWCITALVFLNHLNQMPEKDDPDSQKVFPVKLRILLISSDFSGKLPLIIPSGNGDRSFDIHVNIPYDSRFSSLEINSDDGTKTLSRKLVEVPLALTSGEKSAVIRITPYSTLGLNFSQLSYVPTKFTSFLKISYGKHTLLIIISILAYVIPYIIWILSKRIRYYLGLREDNRIQREIRIIERQKFSIENKIFELRKISEDKKSEAVMQHIQFLDRKLQEIERSISSVPERLRRIFSPRETSFILMVLASTIFILVFLFLTHYISGQNKPRDTVRDRKADAKVMLGDLGMVVESKEPLSDRLTVTFGFFALGHVTGPEGVAEIGIGTHTSHHVDIENIKATPEDRVKIIQQSRKLIRLNVPTRAYQMVNIFTLTDPAMKIETISITESYLTTMKSAHLIKLECIVSGAQKLEERSEGGWFHWFPFDKKLVEIPLQFLQPVLVSKIEISRPDDFFGSISTQGIDLANTAFVEKERKYQLEQGTRRFSVASHENLIIKVNFIRSWLQRHFLTFGQIILAIIAGIGLGILASLPEKNSFGVIIQGIGIISLPWLMRTSVFSSYKELPTVFSGQSMTIFELFFIISVIVFVLLTVFIWKYRVPT